MITIDNMTLYDVEDLAKLLNIQTRTVRKLLRTRQLKGRKLAKRWYVTAESMKEYFKLSEAETQQ